MKVIFGGETKRIPEIKEFDKLINHTADIFNAKKLQAKNACDLKLFYQDDEGDIISVTCQSDLEEAYRIMQGRIKFVFAANEDSASQSLNKGQAAQPNCNNDSFFRSEYIRPNQQQSMLNRSTISQYNSELGPNPMINPQNMMGLMFEAYLQNQIEGMMRQRTMTGTSMMLDLGAQPISGPLPVEGGQPLEPIKAIEEEAIVPNTQEQSNVVNDNESDQNIDEIVRELDEAKAASSAEPAEPAAEEIVEEIVDDVEEVSTDNMVIATSSKDSTQAFCQCSNCKCASCTQGNAESICETCNCLIGEKYLIKPPSSGFSVGDMSFKDVFEKVKSVFSLEPFFEEDPTYCATCIDCPKEFAGVAGADFSAMCTFKNSGRIGWPKNVQLKLINGTIVVYNALGLEDMCVQPGEELNVTIELKLPMTPGTYILAFRLVHGDNIDFGDEVTVNLVARALTGQVESAPAIEDPKLQRALVQPLTETDGDTFYVDEEKDLGGSGASVDDLDLSGNSWIVVRDDEEAAADPPGAMLDEKEVELRTEESTPSKPEVVWRTETEVQRNSYNKQVYMTRYDAKYKDHLVELMKRGCLDFERNLQILQRNGNRLDKAVTELVHEVE